MKKYISFLVTLIVLSACKTETKEVAVANVEDEANVLTPVSNLDMETAVIYEANIRQYSPEGTFDEFTKDIPELKKLGIKIIWLMPVFPISETKRKATGGNDSKFASEFPEEEQANYLGSYYAVSDFSKINPEFGTKDDFRKLIKTAHDNGIYVILDWVPNHTGWDHEWLKSNPEYYTQNENGEVIHPEGTDWTDVADLNYDNTSMRTAMIEDMLYWITEEDIDGFRCDVAGSVPIDFWKQAIPELRNKKDIFMLAEAWEPELLEGDLFDMGYAWDSHHLFNALAKEEKGLEDYDAYINKIASDYDADDILMNFVTNHDENSWNGTIKERMGDASELMTVLSFAMKGMPLIYSGQEYDLDHRLKFFEKDSFPKVKGNNWNLLEKLGELKATNPAWHGGKDAASYRRLESNENSLMFERSKAGESILFVGNISDDESQIAIPQGWNLDYMTNENIEFEGDTLSLQPWGYKILIK